MNQRHQAWRIRFFLKETLSLIHCPRSSTLLVHPTYAAQLWPKAPIKDEELDGQEKVQGAAAAFQEERQAPLQDVAPRLSVSSNRSGIKSSNDSTQLEALSSLAHGTVQARLEQMISHHWDPGVRHQWRMNSAVGETSRRRCSLLIAMDRRSHDPKGDFKMSMIEVITSKRMEEPKELRSLLNCYLLMNSSEQRLVILEAFHEVCSSLFCWRDK